MGIGVGVSAVYAVTMTSGATLTSLVDLAGGWATVYLGVPTMPSGTDIYIKAGINSLATNGFRVMHPPVNSSAAQIHTFVIGSATSQRVVSIPNGFEHLFIEYSTATTATSSTFYIFCKN